MAERCFLRRASPASIATREMRLLCTAIGTRIASLRMAASYDGGGKSQVAIAVLPSLSPSRNGSEGDGPYTVQR